MKLNSVDTNTYYFVSFPRLNRRKDSIRWNTYMREALAYLGARMSRSLQYTGESIDPISHASVMVLQPVGEFCMAADALARWLYLAVGRPVRVRCVTTTIRTAVATVGKKDAALEVVQAPALEETSCK